MRQIWDEKRRQEIHARLRTVDVCVTGYWFCLGCQQISEPESIERFYCAICGSPRLRHHLPIMSEGAGITDSRFQISECEPHLPALTPVLSRPIPSLGEGENGSRPSSVGALRRAERSDKPYRLRAA